MTSLDEIRERNAKYGDHLPAHYQAQLDRRNLLEMVDALQKKADLMPVGFKGKWKAEDKIIAVLNLEPYVDGGLISWELVKEALS